MNEGIFLAFARWINQRPRLEFANYGEMRAYSAEVRRITKDKHAAVKALNEARGYPFDASAMADALQRAYSGRLEWDGEKFNYTAGQYWPTEYRKAAAAVLESYCHAVRPKLPPSPSQRFHTISDLKAANADAGGHWFSRGNMRFASSKVFPGLYHGKHLIWFVSSEAAGFRDERRVFSVRVFDPTGADVNTSGEYGQYHDLTDAREAARELVKRDRAGEHIRPSAQGDKCGFCGHYANYCSAQGVTNGE